ncbi:hypothetical protein EON63_18800 [archaeon]|nr:MAG: hypothetical protein EON63_18800 [archaeon]
MPPGQDGTNSTSGKFQIAEMPKETVTLKLGDIMSFEGSMVGADSGPILGTFDQVKIYISWASNDTTDTRRDSDKRNSSKSY